MTDHTINLEPYRYHIQTWGQAQLPPLVFLHGFMGSCRDFIPVINRLAQHYYCVAIDLPGHGQTQVLGNEDHYRMEAIAPSLIQLIQTLDLSPCHLLGYSMGGRLALYLAIHYAQPFQSVILESVSPGLATVKERRDRLKQDHAIAQRLEQENFEAFLDWWYRLPLFQTLRTHPSYGDMWVQRLQNNPQELARSLRQLSTGKQPSLWSQLPNLDRPCLWIVGGEDEKFIRIGRQVIQLNPEIQLQISGSCGHNIHQEAPILFAQQVHDFITKKNSTPK